MLRDISEIKWKIPPSLVLEHTIPVHALQHMRLKWEDVAALLVPTEREAQVCRWEIPGICASKQLSE